MQQRLLAIRQQIAAAASRAGRDAGDICLIAVSKTRSLAEVQQACACGQTVFGENQLQDASGKIQGCPYPQAEWHFIGHLQSNKVKSVAGEFQWLHTLDSIKLANRLNAVMQNANIEPSLNCLLQVNVSGEASKSGVLPDDVDALLSALVAEDYPSLKLRGFMTIGVQGDPAKTRAVFAQLRELRDHYRERYHLAEFDQLSMGMSDDFEIAIEEGATMVRIGTRLFGEREKQDS